MVYRWRDFGCSIAFGRTTFTILNLHEKQWHSTNTTTYNNNTVKSQRLPSFHCVFFVQSFIFLFPPWMFHGVNCQTTPCIIPFSFLIFGGPIAFFFWLKPSKVATANQTRPYHGHRKVDMEPNNKIVYELESCAWLPERERNFVLNTFA